MSAVLSEDVVADVHAARVVDTRGNACPGPLLNARREIVNVAVGEVLELWSSESQCRIDVRVWAGKVGHEFLGFCQAAGYDRIFVRRRK